LQDYDPRTQTLDYHHLTDTPATALDATLQRFKELPGLYYDHIGEAQLYMELEF